MPAPEEKKPHPLRGKDVPIPEDMPELPDDLTIIARLIDANCRAHSDLYGFHLDSRCLSHYNEGIVRLVQAGLMDVSPVLESDGTPKVRKVKKTDPAGAEFEDEELVYYEEVTDAPAQAMRVRAKYVPLEKMTDRPTSDPIWKLQADEMARLRQELKVARQNQKVDHGHAPEGVGTAPRLTPDEAVAPMMMAAAAPVEEDDIPQWMIDRPETPVPDFSAMPGGGRPPGYWGSPFPPPSPAAPEDVT
jgi:hypothetical protein